MCIRDSLKTFRRHVVYVRPDYFLIFDELESDGTPRTFASLLHTDNQGELSKQDGYVVIEKQKQRLWTQVLLPERATLEFTRLEGSTRYGPYVRIAKPEPFVKGSYLMLLAPQAAAPPAGVFEAENLLPPKATTPGNSIVAVTSDVASYVNFFRINSAQDADFVTLALNVKRAGDYEVRFCFIKNTFCGMVDIELDGTKIGSFDGYAPKIERTQETAYGTHALAAGEHTVTFRVTGKNPASTDRYLGLDYIRLVSDDMVAEEPAKPQAPAHAEAEWDGDRIVVKVQVGHERRDTVVLNPGREQFSFEGDAGDGPVLLVKNGNAYWAPARP